MEYSKNLEQFLEKNKNKNIVFTNGCFDIVHRGHVTYLNEARKLGDLLIVGMNSDSSVRGLKGDSRPINKELDRKFVLENFKCVDLVEIFSDETPLSLIKKIKPNVLVKGGDWAIDKIVGSDFVLKNGGTVKSIDFVDGYSTTSIIEKMK